MKPLTIVLVRCVAVGAMLIAGCNNPPPPVVEAPPKSTAPPTPKLIQLATLSPVTLEPGGRALVELKVKRNGNGGPIQIQVGEMPEGITAKAEDIAQDKSTGQLELAAAVSLGNTDLVASLSVMVSAGDLKSKQPLELKVPKLNLPSFLPANQVLLQPGTSKVVDVRIQRNGFQGALKVRVEGALAKVSGKVAAIAADKNATTLEITVAANASDGSHKLRVATTLYGRNINVEVPLKIERRPFEVDSFRVVTLAPGQVTRVDVPVNRRSYKGTLRITANDLPKGIVMRDVQVAADQTKATLEIEASADAEQRVHSSSIVSAAGHLTTNGPIVIRIAGDDDTYLPPAIAANPDIAPLLRRGSIGGRLTSESKQALLDFYGGTAESEAAVMLGLKWLAAHQQPNGSWPLDSYSQDIPDCDCQTEFEKNLDKKTETAGTAFGVLAFLGAGVTHNRAPKYPPELAGYQEVVKKGLVYLSQHQQRSRGNKDGYLGGNTYAHALGTMAFCEAYGLSGDDKSKINAQMALKYLLNAQHKKGGGWRYSPGQPGDMSVTGWVFLAIRGAQLAGIMVRRPPLIRAGRFVDSCGVGPAGAEQSRYAYTPERPEKLALTAAGLLTRQYLGWGKDEPDLLAGSEYLMQHMPPESGASLGQIYYYYYATQVLHHLEGPNFDLWNHRMREHLIRTQEKTGHKAGSWSPVGVDYGSRAGRVYSTAMAIFTLQVYYRHLPMYRHVKRTGTKVSGTVPE